VGTKENSGEQKELKKMKEKNQQKKLPKSEKKVQA
jgi:hypothetical protein